MARKDYTPEQAIGMLGEAEVRLSQGEKIGKICRASEVIASIEPVREDPRLAWQSNCSLRISGLL